MPVYLRKNTKFTPDSLQNFNPVEDDLDDFIQDPDLFIDRLPQPYRLIDKLCNNIVDRAWDIIVQRETKRTAEASKIRPPKYTSDIQIEIHGSTKSLCSSPKGELIFLGRPDGLSVINALTQETIDDWKDDKMDVVDVSVFSVEENNYLITTIDDMGVGRIFLFSENNIYLMCSFNEPATSAESSASADISKRDKGQTQANMMMGSTKKEKPIVTKCEASKNGDYIGVCFQNTQTQEYWLEFFKINKETLLKEIEAANNKFAKKPDIQQQDGNAAEAEPTGEDTEPPVENQPDSSRTEGSEGRTDSLQNIRSSMNKTQPSISPFSAPSSASIRKSNKLTLPPLSSINSNKTNYSENSGNISRKSARSKHKLVTSFGDLIRPDSENGRDTSLSIASTLSSDVFFQSSVCQTPSCCFCQKSAKSNVSSNNWKTLTIDRHSSAKSSPAKSGRISRTKDVDGDGPEKKESPHSQTSGNKRSQKFTAPQAVLKVKPPQPIVGANHVTPFSAQKSIDETGDVLGTGAKHLLSSYHIEMKKAIFEHMHEDLVQYLPKITKPAIMEPTFHFLNAGRLFPHGLEQPALQGQPTTVAIWWEGQFQVMMYSLIKQGGKDIEHKPEMVWPMSSGIKYSTVTPDCSLLAIALENNNVVIWDLQLGIPRRIVHVSDQGQIFKLLFLNPNLYAEKSAPSLGGSKPYTLATNCYLLVVFNDGQMFKVTCGLNDASLPENISPSLEQWESHTVVEPIIGIPELVVTCRKNGQVFIEDITNGSIVLEISVMDPFCVFTPWQPVFAIGGNGNVLYVKGHAAIQKDETNAEDGTAAETSTVDEKLALFVFKLRSVPNLDQYRRKTRNNSNTFVVHPTLEQRTQALFKERISHQGTRTVRMQQRWGQLKEELELIKELREKAEKKGAPRSAYSESTIVRTPALDLTSRHSGQHKSP